ncbi:MAG: MFS transporter [Rhodospirillaceae bacterium]
MTMDVSAAPLDEAAHQKQLRRAVIASTIGTAIEWYDFFLYGIVAGLVLAPLYFPTSDPLTGTFLAFSTFAVGFVARPVGAAIFGHYGDRIGRKASLVATLMLMGFATFAVALVPAYESIGLWGAAILTLLRFLQGVGVGGEWGGAVLMSMEWTRTNKHRGFAASWPQFGVPLGLALANLVVLGVSLATGDDFLTYGWRIPFFLSLFLVGVGMYIRLGVVETPTFRKLQEKNEIAEAPMLEVVKRHPKEIILSALARVGENASFYIFTTFVLAYGTQYLKYSRDVLLEALLIAALLGFVWIPLSGYLSDRIGRRKMYLIGVSFTAVFSFVYFAMMGASPTATFAAIAISLLAHSMMYGPQAALIAESFTGRLRYSGASIGYQLTAIVAGGPAPIVATALLAYYGSGYAIAAYLFVCCLISIAATLALKDRTGKDIDSEQEYR